LDKVQTASAAGKISESAAENIRTWLSDRRYEKYVAGIQEHIDRQMWPALDDVFWTTIPFGTGGRRGKMYPFGCNAINERTIGESAQGLAAYVKANKPAGPWSAAIAYDTRHRSREFAELCAGILVANEFVVYFIDQYRSTPELSFLIRYKNCDCGIMVTASHNPPSDNAVKVYWSSGVQLVPPHDKAVIDQVNKVDSIEVADVEDAVATGKIRIVTRETDAALMQEHLRQSYPGPRNLKVIYSPLHGVGEFNVKSLLNEAGFEDLVIYERHRQPNGDFPNVPGNISNPENKQVFEEIIVQAQQTGADLILATDPDCDRMGAAAPLTVDSRGPWETLNGNQLASLLCDFVLSKSKQAGILDSANYIVTTLVTTGMLARIAKFYGVKCYDQNLVGFKWICSLMDVKGPDKFVFGTEESHGYLVGQYCRDKDGAVACMLMSELAAEVKAAGISLFEHLNRLFLAHGYHAEDQVNIRMEGADGMLRMKKLMERFRNEPPTSLAGLQVSGIRDYLTNSRVDVTGSRQPLPGPTDNLIFVETEAPGNYVAARPSGTEPKVKLYLFSHVPANEIEDLVICKSAMRQRLDAFRRDLEGIAASV
jgi:phosphoglucomutase/phosphomannomutase